MARTSLIVAVLAAAAGRIDSLSVNQAVEERALARSKALMHHVQMEADSAANALRENMTLEKALTSVSKRTNSTPAFMSMIQGVVQSQRRIRKQHHHASHFLGLVSRKSQDDPEYASGIEKAKTMINEMLTEVAGKIDSTHMRCKKDFDDKCQMMEFLRADILEMNAQTANSNGDVLKFQGKVTFAEETELPRLQGLLENNRETCSEKISHQNKQKETVESDIEVINGVLDMTDCKKASFIQRKQTLLKCSDCQNTTSVYRFQHVGLQQKLSSIKTAGIQERVLAALKSMADSGARQNKQDHSNNAEKEDNDADVPDEVEVPPDPCNGVSYDKRSEGYEGGCSIATNPSCTILSEKFLEIQVQMFEVKEHIKQKMQDIATDCAVLEKAINADIARTSTILLQDEAELAFATKSMQRTGLAEQTKRAEHVKYTKQLEDMRDECISNLKDYEAEQCQLEKIRSEIFLKTSTNTIEDAMFVDCKVDEWKSSECSAECGGGTQTLTRNIVTAPAFGGVVCPDLSAVQDCNTHGCPINCIEGEWSGWSSCSAGCDGGVKLHTREITTHPSGGGTPCGPVTETEVCETQTCDPDCTLYDWTKWSECSKACSKGHKHRIRIESTPATGAGTCPDVFGPERFQELTCNEQACPIGVKDIDCKAKLDIVFLVDGSGSLGKDAFDAELDFVSNLTHAFEGHDAEISVVLFSGPLYWSDYWTCTFSHQMLTKEILKKTCGIETLSHLTTDMGAVRTAVTGVDYPGLTTFTSGALRMAETELRFARAGAERIVITLTDGVPIDNDWTAFAARSLQQSGIRMVIVPIENLGLTGNEPILQQLASPNKEDNTMEIVDWRTMFQFSTQATLVEDVCGLEVEFPIAEAR